MTITVNVIKPDDARIVESREFGVEEIARLRNIRVEDANFVAGALFTCCHPFSYAVTSEEGLRILGKLTRPPNMKPDKEK